MAGRLFILFAIVCTPPEKVFQKIRKTIFGVWLNFNGIETKFLFYQISEFYRLLRHNIFDEVIGFLRLLHSTVNIFEKCLISRRTATD